MIGFKAVVQPAVKKSHSNRSLDETHLDTNNSLHVAKKGTGISRSVSDVNTTAKGKSKTLDGPSSLVSISGDFEIFCNMFFMRCQVLINPFHLGCCSSPRSASTDCHISEFKWINFWNHMKTSISIPPRKRQKTPCRSAISIKLLCNIIERNFGIAFSDVFGGNRNGGFSMISGSARNNGWSKVNWPPEYFMTGHSDRLLLIYFQCEVFHWNHVPKVYM